MFDRRGCSILFTPMLFLVVVYCCCSVFPFIFHYLFFFICLLSVSFILIEFVYKPFFFADEEELMEKKETSVIELTDSP